jgi:hypothetical protein
MLRESRHLRARTEAVRAEGRAITVQRSNSVSAVELST